VFNGRHIRRMTNVHRNTRGFGDNSGSRSIEELIDLPLMTDPDWARNHRRSRRSSFRQQCSPTRFWQPHRRSITTSSLGAWQQHGIVLCLRLAWHDSRAPFCDYRAGFRFGRLGYELVEKRGLHRYQARAYVAFANLVMPWTKPIHPDGIWCDAPSTPQQDRRPSLLQPIAVTT